MELELKGAVLLLAATLAGFAGARTAVEEFAERELGEWIGRLAEKGPEERIRVGVEYADLFPADKASLGETDGFACRRKDGAIYIFATKPRGVLYGVYSFLERNSDLIWARPDEGCGAIYSRKRRFEIADADFIEVPSFVERGWQFCGKGEDIAGDLWRARLRNNWIGPTVSAKNANAGEVKRALRLGFDVFGANGHNLPTYFTGKVLAQHPEYLMEQDGKRPKSKIVSKRQFCFSNMEAADAAAAEAVRQIRAAKRAGLPFDKWAIKQADTKAFCTCANCREPIRLEDGSVVSPEAENFKSTLFFRWLNRVMETVARSYPDLRVATFAYLYSAPPPGLKVHPNLDVAYCPFIKNDRFNVFAPENAKWRDRTLGWAAATTNVRVREYWGCACGFPRPLSLVAAEDLKWYRKLGFSKVYSETCRDLCRRDEETGDVVLVGGSRFSSWDLSAMEHWVISRLMWNPDQSVQALRDEYCTRTYRRAAAPMKRFFALIAEKWFADSAMTYYRDDAFSNAAHYLIRTRVADEMSSLLAEAERLAAADVPATRTLLHRQREYFEALLAGARKQEAPLAVPCRIEDFLITGGCARENNVKGKGPMTADVSVEGRKLKVKFLCWRLLTKDDSVEVAVVGGDGKVRKFVKTTDECVRDAENYRATADFEIDLDELGITGDRVRANLSCRLGSMQAAEYLKSRSWRGVGADDAAHYGELLLPR